MTYTIETRQLTSEYTHRPTLEEQPAQRTIEAADVDDAIRQFVGQNDWELVSLTRPLTGSESIATAKKDDTVFLVRVYCN